MSDEALVTAAEIARIADVGRAAVSNWRRRYPDFPKPVLGAGNNPVFSLAEVRNWLRKQGKLSELPPHEALWRALDAARGERDVVELVAQVASHLRAPESVELPETIRAALKEVGDEDTGELIELLISMLFNRQQRQHLVTPPELAELMVQLAGASGTVFDPACGAGNVLRAAVNAGATEVAGQEIEASLASLAESRLSDITATVRVADTLRSDMFPNLRADAVVCDPPFGYRDWGYDELKVDPRWTFGIPAKGEPELAWAQHCLAHVKPGGTVVLAMPAGAAARRSGRPIRQELVRRGVLQAVFALPAGVLMSTGIAIHLWVLRRPDTEGVGPVLLMDTGHHQPARRGQVDWSVIGSEILEAWRLFQHDTGVGDLPARRRVTEPIELLGEEVDFTPVRHLPAPPREVDFTKMERDRAELRRLLDRIAGDWLDLRDAEPVPRAVTTVGELAKVGALGLIRQTSPVDADENGTGRLVLTGNDVVTGTEPRLRCSEDAEAVPLRSGDLVVPVVAAGEGHTVPRVIDTEEWSLGANLFLIRVDTERLDPWFLSGQLRAGGHAANSVTASGVHRIDIRRAEIPVIGIDEQRRIGAAFRRLTEWESELNKAVEINTRLTRQLISGLADGTVTLSE
ncbi:N-6 DNA methylase [Actinopolyspora mortivallis]|uniref:N-6 DNA methylase n=1 Tax=Actinopolyspora mortivallis TaxID=33906 RepID=A0A2T0H1W8_ACTMO|nr:N-6 DNA methylase [Actinopolyspora mortivallis]PRW65365.1 N-6 DNA methylase [Actinopolyspora mortivallis]